MRPAALPQSRRSFLGGALAASAAPALAGRAPADKAHVAITLDLEMSRHYPTWDQTHWDYEKGNLDADTKRYAVEAARRVKRRGGVIHFFAVGRVLEQEDVGWLKEIHEAGHPVGNHTYDHVNVKATRPDQVQFRFQRAPWLIEGKTPAQVITENVAVTTRALRQRVGITADGFRTPGGFNDGLRDRIVKAQALAQPFAYPNGLVEVPMSPVSDVSALRAGRWPLDDFLEALRRGVSWAVEHRAAFDFLGHPSCLVVADPKFRAIDLVCDLVERAKGRAALTDLDTIAARVKGE
jgi:peptidoglycan/xylan/chitin deacetylase (PgdA/CDA1 family)